MRGLRLWWERSRNMTIFLSIIMLDGPGILFLVGEWSFMSAHLSVAVPIIFLLILLLANGSLFSTTFSDPGFLPKNLHAHLNPLFDAPPPQMDGTHAYPFFPQMPQLHAREVGINGQIVRLKFCETCNIFRPPRCSHCSICDRCILSHDHHCPWVANCVGKWNYRQFFVFITCSAVLCIYGFSFSLTHMLMTGGDLAAADKPSGPVDVIIAVPISFLVVLFSFMLSFNLFGFSVYHLLLITRNLTTHEKMKQAFAFDPTPNPFEFPSKWENCLRIDITRQTMALLLRPPLRDNKSLKRS